MTDDGVVPNLNEIQSQARLICYKISILVRNGFSHTHNIKMLLCVAAPCHDEYKDFTA